MNKAHQQALYQTTNQGLLGIRQAEIGYYIGIHAACATQAALVGGFTYGMYTQNPLASGTIGERWIADVYYLVAALTVATAVHVILVTMLIQVLGPGLALHGPIGSMVIAANGMRAEQKQITVAFTLMLIFFILTTVCAGWVVFPWEGALAATIVFVVALKYYYASCERIYLRFYWEHNDNRWKDRRASDVDSIDDDDDPAGEPMRSSMIVNPILATSQSKSAATPSNTAATTSSGGSSTIPAHSGGASGNGISASNTVDKKAKKKKKKPFLTYMFGGILSRPEESDQVSTIYDGDSTYQPPAHMDEAMAAELRNSISANELRASMAQAVPPLRGVVMEGYLTTKSVKWVRPIARSNVMERKGAVWERRYFTLNQMAQLYCYKSRQEYRADPRSQIYTRPVLLSDHFVHVDNMDAEMRLEGAAYNADRFTVADDEAYSEGGDDGYDGVPRGSMMLNKSATSGKVGKKLVPYRFQITLVPRDNEHHDEREQHRNDWVLRCDTEEELLVWVGVMREISPDSFRT